MVTGSYRTDGVGTATYISLFRDYPLTLRIELLNALNRLLNGVDKFAR